MDTRGKAAAAAVTAAAVAGIAVHAAVERPADLLPEQAAAVIRTEEPAASPENVRTGYAARLEAWLLALPAAVRMLVVLPLWCAGWVLLTAVNAFTAGLATPLLARVLGWLCLSLVLLVCFAVGAKAAFPKAKLHSLLRPANLLLPAATALVLCGADLVLPTVWDGYGAVSRWVWRIGGACLLATMCRMELHHQGKAAQRRAAELPTLPVRTEVEREAMRLADTVCPKP